MKTQLHLFLLLFISATAFAQPPIIFRPGPGNNDGTDEGGLTGGKDAFVYEGNPSGNYGDNAVFQALPVSNCNQTHAEAFLQFDLSTLPENVESVHLGVKHASHTTYCYSGCAADFYFAILTAAWDEMTINYNNFPARGADIYGPVSISFPNDFGTMEYDITDAYNAWKSETIPNYGFTIYSLTVDCNNAAVFFMGSSSDDTEEANRPYLKIVESSVGIDKGAQTTHCRVFPSPASDALNVVFTLGSPQTVNFTLTDLAGRTVYATEKMLNSGEQKINLSLANLQAGMLLYTLTTTEGSISGKVLKK